MVRRLVAGGALLILLLLIILGIHSCQVSARNSSLKDYNNNVASLIQSSDGIGQQLFTQLAGAGSADANSLTNHLNELRVAADGQLSKAKSLDVPGEVAGAQQHLVDVLTMRRDGIAGIATQISRALGASGNTDAINQIAAQMALFYASDALYKGYTTTKIAAALHAAGIAVGPNGVTIEGGQFLPDLGWLTPSFIATKLGGTSSSSSTATPTPGTHGHSLDSVTVNGTTLQTGSTNTISASPPPTFTLNYTNGGQNDETNVVAQVSLNPSGGSGQTIIPTTTHSQSGSVDVKLSSSPAPGNYTVKATIKPVPGEKNTDNNTQSFPVTFQ